MDKTAGSVRGGDEVYLLCDKVQKGEAETLWALETFVGCKGNFRINAVGLQVLPAAKPHFSL